MIGLKRRPALREALGNSAWLLVDRGFRLLVGLAVGVWIARHLGPSDYGMLNFALAVVSFYAVFVTFGLDGLAVRDLVEHPTQRDSIIGTVALIRLPGSVMAFSLALGTILLLQGASPMMVGLVAILAAASFFQAAEAIDLWFQATVRSRYTVLAKGVAFGLASLVRVALLISAAQVLAFAWAILLEALLGALALLYAYRITGGRITAWRANASRAKAMLREGWPLALSGLTIAFYMRVDQIMLGQLAGFADVGTYSVAVRLVELWYVVPMTVTASLFPAILIAKQAAPEYFVSRVQVMYDVLVWGAIAIALLVSVLAHPIVDILYGRAYSGAAPVLSLLCWMGVLVFFGVARQKWLFAERALGAGSAVELVTLVLNVVFNLILIPRFGALGAAGASMGALICANIAVAVFSNAIRRSLWMFGAALLAPFRLVGSCRRLRG
jgi:PST family polysaccharide transporter